MIGLGRLSLNQATVRSLTATQAIELCVQHEISAIGLWRDRVAELGLSATSAAVRAAGLRVSSLCRGGFFTHRDPQARAAALADNRAAVTEAAALGADALILVLALQFPADTVGVVVDTYHVWWDAQLAADLGRAAGRIVSYQLCDWILPLPSDVLLGRGHLGDGFIDFRLISSQVLAAGYGGFAEVEILNQQIWDAPSDETAATVRSRFAELLG